MPVGRNENYFIILRSCKTHFKIIHTKKNIKTYRLIIINLILIWYLLIIYRFGVKLYLYRLYDKQTPHKIKRRTENIFYFSPCIQVTQNFSHNICDYRCKLQPCGAKRTLVSRMSQPFIFEPHDITFAICLNIMFQEPTRTRKFTLYWWKQYYCCQGK